MRRGEKKIITWSDSVSPDKYINTNSLCSNDKLNKGFANKNEIISLSFGSFRLIKKTLNNSETVNSSKGATSHGKFGYIFSDGKNSSCSVSLMFGSNKGCPSKICWVLNKIK